MHSRYLKDNDTRGIDGYRINYDTCFSSCADTLTDDELTLGTYPIVPAANDILQASRPTGTRKEFIF